jgi:hypothetical protein
VFRILTRYETGFLNDPECFSITFRTGTGSGGPQILAETCNGEMFRTLTRCETGFAQTSQRLSQGLI